MAFLSLIGKWWQNQTIGIPMVAAKARLAAKRRFPFAGKHSKSQFQSAIPVRQQVLFAP
jgi:hypothetical protein